TYNPISGSIASIAYQAEGGLPAETVNYSYNQNGVLSNLGGATSYLSSTVVDPYGRITTWKMGAMPYQAAQTNLYDQATGSLLGQTFDRETADTHVDDITSLYDPSGKITATRDIQDGSKTDLQCYAYNGLGQLTDAWSDSGDVVRSDPQVAV